MTRRAVGYSRYSTDLQNERSIEDQEALIRRYASLNGLTLGQLYSDAALSGASIIGRDGLLSLLADARRGGPRQSGGSPSLTPRSGACCPLWRAASGMPTVWQTTMPPGAASWMRPGPRLAVCRRRWTTWPCTRWRCRGIAAPWPTSPA